MDETSDVQESDKRSGSRFNDDVSYGEWSQEQMEKFMTSFDESRRNRKKRKKTIDKVEQDVI